MGVVEGGGGWGFDFRERNDGTCWRTKEGFRDRLLGMFCFMVAADGGKFSRGG